MHSIAAIEQQFVRDLEALYDSDEAKKMCFLIMEELMDLSKSAYLLKRHEPIRIEYHAGISAALELLKTGKPIQYLLGHAWFMEMKLAVNESVLIPRPETEELVHLVISDCQGAKMPLRIIDIGTGSGCIAIALQKAMAFSKTYALDVSANALAVAKENARSQQTEIAFINADILEWDVFFQEDQHFDIIVSNPPYIAVEEQDKMHRNVLDHEPHLALFVEGDAPLLFYDHIAAFASKHLSDSGRLYFEINRMYGYEVCDLLRKKGFVEVELRQDMQGNDRIVKAKKRSNNNLCKK